MEEKIIEYDLLVDGDFKSLTGKVNNLLNENKGWKPLGGIAVTQKGDDGPTIFAQAMVRINEGS